MRQRDGEVDRARGLADAALLVGDGDHPAVRGLGEGVVAAGVADPDGLGGLAHDRGVEAVTVRRGDPTASSSTLRIRVRLASSSVTFSSSLLSPSSEGDSPPSCDPNHPTGAGVPSTGSRAGCSGSASRRVRVGGLPPCSSPRPPSSCRRPAPYPSSPRSPSRADSRLRDRRVRGAGQRTRRRPAPRPRSNPSSPAAGHRGAAAAGTSRRAGPAGRPHGR